MRSLVVMMIAAIALTMAWDSTEAFAGSKKKKGAKAEVATTTEQPAFRVELVLDGGKIPRQDRLPKDSSDDEQLTLLGYLPVASELDLKDKHGYTLVVASSKSRAKKVAKRIRRFGKRGTFVLVTIGRESLEKAGLSIKKLKRGSALTLTFATLTGRTASGMALFHSKRVRKVVRHREPVEGDDGEG